LVGFFSATASLHVSGNNSALARYRQIERPRRPLVDGRLDPRRQRMRIVRRDLEHEFVVDAENQVPQACGVDPQGRFDDHVPGYRLDAIMDGEWSGQARDDKSVVVSGVENIEYGFPSWSIRYSSVVTPIPLRSDASVTVISPQGVAMRRERRVLRACVL